MSSDISNYIRRNGSADRDDINKLLSILNPLVFPDPENSSLKERIVVSPHFRNRIITAITGNDIITTSSQSRKRFSSAITIIPNSATTTAPTYTATLSGTLSFPTDKKNGGGATFSGTEYYTLTDTGDSLDLTSGQFGMTFWFKSNGSDEGEMTIYSKRQGDLIEDYCGSCNNFDSTNFFTYPNPSNPGLTISLTGNTTQDYCSACSNFDTNNFDTTTQNTGVRVIMADGSNSITGIITSSTNIYDGNWHAITINASDIVSDYCSACNNFNSSNYSVVTTPNIQVYVDGVSIGSVSHAAITGSLQNSENAYFGGVNNTGTIEDLLKGSVAFWEFQDQPFSSTAISDYYSNARIRSSGQLAALHFTGNATELDVLDNIT